MAPRARVGRPSSRYPWLRLTPFNLLALGLVLVLGIAFLTRIPALNGSARVRCAISRQALDYWLNCRLESEPPHCDTYDIFHHKVNNISTDSLPTQTHHLAAEDIVDETPSTGRPVEGHATKEGMKRFADRHAGE
jgi:hypothetical protein